MTASPEVLREAAACASYVREIRQRVDEEGANDQRLIDGTDDLLMQSNYAGSGATAFASARNLLTEANTKRNTALTLAGDIFDENARLTQQVSEESGQQTNQAGAEIEGISAGLPLK
jgi:hypothetical protein